MGDLFPISAPEITDYSPISPASDPVTLVEGCCETIVESCLNAAGRRVVTQLCCADPVGISRYVHVIVSHKDYQSYLDRAITFRALQERADEFYVEDAIQLTGSHECSSRLWRLSLDDIPDGYRPTDQSWHDPKLADWWSSTLAADTSDGPTP